jgi:hypothetical protein
LQMKWKKFVMSSRNLNRGWRMQTEVEDELKKSNGWGSGRSWWWVEEV